MEQLWDDDGLIDQIEKVVEQLQWDINDDIAIEVAGTSIYEIDGAGTKWAPVKGTRKYNKDAFIIIKNKSRTPFEPSQPNPELIAHHLKEEEKTDD